MSFTSFTTLFSRTALEPEFDRSRQDLSSQQIHLPKDIIEKIATLQRISFNTERLINEILKEAVPFCVQGVDDTPLCSLIEEFAGTVHRLAFVIATLAEEKPDDVTKRMHLVHGALEAGFIELPSIKEGFGAISGERAKSLRLMASEEYAAWREANERAFLLGQVVPPICTTNEPSVRLGHDCVPQQFILKFRSPDFMRPYSYNYGVAIPVDAVLAVLGEEQTARVVEQYKNIGDLLDPIGPFNNCRFIQLRIPRER